MVICTMLQINFGMPLIHLHDWKEKGGSGIKLRNGINGSIGTWKGPSVSRFNTPETLATLICRAAKIRANA